LLFFLRGNKIRGGEERLFALYYIRWIGTSGELKEYVDRVNKIANETEGVTLKGLFSPTSAWNFVMLFDGESYNKVLEVYKAYMIKYGPHPKVPVGKVEVLHELEELGFSM
jgi:hypothetical protein